MNRHCYHRTILKLAAVAAATLLIIRASEPVNSLAAGPGKRADGQWVAAPGYTMASWGAAEGLPQMTPRAITQTRDGYLWVGTFNGLARFDGVRFTSFTAGNTPELASDHITQLLEDSAGTLWIGTSEGGLVSYREGKFSVVGGAEISGATMVRAICEDGRGVVWVGTSEGLCRVRSGRLERHPLLDRGVVSIFRGVGEEVWIGTNSDIRRMGGDGNWDEPITSARRVRYWTMDVTGQIWASYMEGNLGRVVRDEGRVREAVPHARFKVDVFHRGQNGRLWMGTLSGPLHELEPGAAQPYVVRADFKTGVTALFEDHDGNLWVGLEARGLWRLRKSAFVALGEEQGLPVQPVTSICEDGRGRIWSGTFGKSFYLWDGERFAEVAVPGVPGQVVTLLPARDGKLWFGTYGGRLARRVDEGAMEYEGTFGKHTRTLFEDRDGGIWCGKFLDGLFYRAPDGSERRYSERDGLSNDAVQAIAQDRAGDLWVGTAKGLNRLRGSKIERFFRKDGLAGENVRALFVDSRGTLWIGSTGGGLTRWNGERLESIGVREGLVNDGIEQIIEDGEGFLWLGSNAGLMRVELGRLNDCVSRRVADVHCMVFRRETGTPQGFGTGYQPSCFKASDGKLWFGTAAGIVVIDPAEIQPVGAAPLVYVEELKTDKDSWAIAAGGEEMKVVPAGTRRLEFRYTGLDFEAPTLVRFRHKLEGVDSDWVNAGSRRDAVYMRVPPGSYRFRVSAANNQGVWNETGATMEFVVEPFFWQTRTFRFAAPMAGLLASGGVAWGFVTRRHRRELERLERQHALERERTRIAQDMHDGLGSSLVKISLLGERVARSLSVPEQTKAQAQKITATARQVMTEMDEIVWAVNPKNDTLENFAGYLCRFVQEHFNDTEMQCHVDVPAQLPAAAVGAEIRHNLLLAVREALNNSVKHSQGKEVRVAMEYCEPQIRIEIQDNGIGMQGQADGFRNGLGNMRRRVEGLGGEVKIESGSTGTRIRMALKIDGEAGRKHMFM